jgi:hypothetical protein
MAIKNTAIGTTDTTLYTSNGNNAITTVIVCNTAVYDPLNPETGKTYLYLYAVPFGETQSSVHLIVNKLPIPAGETVSFDQEKMVLADGDRLIAKSESPDNLVSTVSTLAV